VEHNAEGTTKYRPPDKWQIWAGMALLTLLYLLLLVIPYYGSMFRGSTFDPNCLGRCPDLDVAWYPLWSIEAPGSLLYNLTRLTFSCGPCIGLATLILLSSEIINSWHNTSQRVNITRVAIMLSFVTVLLLTYYNFSDMASWMFDW
jgi:hypothetical protein